MPLEGLSFVKTTFGIIYATDQILHNMTTIVCLYAELRAPIFQNQGSFPHALSWCPQF